MRHSDSEYDAIITEEQGMIGLPDNPRSLPLVERVVDTLLATSPRDHAGGGTTG
jgi:hypothetical protein